jgi:hypothetical protein
MGILMNKEIQSDYKAERREKALKETDVLLQHLVLHPSACG